MAGLAKYFALLDNVAFASNDDAAAFRQHYRPVFEAADWPLERNAENERLVQRLASHVVFSRLADRDLVERSLFKADVSCGHHRGQQMNLLGPMSASGGGKINFAPVQTTVF